MVSLRSILIRESLDLSWVKGKVDADTTVNKCVESIIIIAAWILFIVLPVILNTQYHLLMTYLFLLCHKMFFIWM